MARIDRDYLTADTCDSRVAVCAKAVAACVASSTLARGCGSVERSIDFYCKMLGIAAEGPHWY